MIELENIYSWFLNIKKLSQYVCIYVHMYIYMVYTNTRIGNTVIQQEGEYNDKVHYVRGKMQQGFLSYCIKNKKY